MKPIYSPVLIALLAFSFTHCDEDEENECFECAYEKRKTSCSSSSFGSWESLTSGAVFTEDIKEGLSKQEYCDLVYPSSDLECAAGCCINFQFRNVTVESCN